ncbi:MAG: phosphotransferase [bacterium]
MDGLLQRLGIDKERLWETVRADLVEITGGDADGFKMEALPGGASVRGYARLYPRSGDSDSLVLMILCDPDPARGIEEVMAEDSITELPFINVHRHLSSCGVNTPRIVHYNRKEGLIYLEDLGGEHLRDYVQKRGPDAARHGFEKAIYELTKIQVDCTRYEAAGFLGFRACFDFDLLMWELEHFTEHAVEARFPGALDETDRDRTRNHFKSIAGELLEGPYALQHRDYHMDNLLLCNGAIRVIDFQDALMGPLAYDLACLLYDRDTSWVLGDELIDHLVTYYCRSYEERSGKALSEGLFRRNFHLCVIHRLLKVVGRFHYIHQVKRRPEYLDYIPYMLPPLCKYLERDPEHRALLDVFTKYLPELAETRGTLA